MRIEQDLKLDFSDVLIRPKRSSLSSRNEVDVTRKYKFINYESHINNDYHYEGIPIMASNMDGVGTFEMATVLSEMKIFTCLVKTYSAEDIIDFFTNDNTGKKTEHVAMTIGITDDDYKKFQKVYNSLGYELKYVCIDVANGYSQSFVDFIKKFKYSYPNVVIIAGNVVTGEMVEELLLAGASIIKAGIGPGKFCKSRKVTGVGYPQLSAVIECADAAHGLRGHIISDGGCYSSGDIAKAISGGSDFVMLGSMLAGHDEGGGEIITKYYNTGEVVKSPITGTNRYGTEFEPVYEERKYVEFYGMSSKKANDKHFGGLKSYRASEGYEGFVPYRGEVSNTVQDILGGLRSTCTYCGASKLKELSKRATFVLVNNQHNGGYKK